MSSAGKSVVPAAGRPSRPSMASAEQLAGMDMSRPSVYNGVIRNLQRHEVRSKNSAQKMKMLGGGLSLSVFVMLCMIGAMFGASQYSWYTNTDPVTAELLGAGGLALSTGNTFQVAEENEIADLATFTLENAGELAEFKQVSIQVKNVVENLNVVASRVDSDGSAELDFANNGRSGSIASLRVDQANGQDPVAYLITVNGSESFIDIFPQRPEANNTIEMGNSGRQLKVHGSLARAGKVKGQTPKVEPQEKKKKKTGRAKRRIQYNKRFVNVVVGFKKRGPNSNSERR